MSLKEEDRKVIVGHEAEAESERMSGDGEGTI